MISNFRVLITGAKRLFADVLLSGAAFTLVIVLPLTQARSLQMLPWRGLLSHVSLFMLSAMAAHLLCRTYRMIWRYVNFRDLLSLIQASGFTILCFALVDFLLLNPKSNVPGSLLLWTLLLIWIATVGFLATPRLVVRALAESLPLWTSSLPQPLRHKLTPVLLSGDVRRMDAFIRENNHDPNSKYQVVGVVSDDKGMHGSYLHGTQVLGRLKDIREVMRYLTIRGVQPQMLVIADAAPKQDDFKRHLELAASVGLKIGRMPPPGVMREKVQPIEIADLLGRPEIRTDNAAITTMIRGKRVLVTGAGGSIGSELCRQIASLNPAELITADFGEFNLYSIDKELSEKFPNILRKTALFDVRDAEMVSFWFNEVRPEIVFHAAALKHVPLVEDHPIEGVKTNVFGTIHIAEACVKYGVAAMVTISTDKAVNPSNAMGATKRLAESYCQGLDQLSRGQITTNFVTVRFGNVLGSAGSVVPLFQRQIEEGGPVTVTHPDIKRYFMTIPEAVTLVLQAGARGMRSDSRRGGIYVLDMGQPVKIIDLARHMIQLSGLRPDLDIQIKIMGLRPGEKLYEEVVHNDESLISSGNDPIMQVVPRTTDLTILRQQVLELRQACSTKDFERVMRLLKVSVPEFSSVADKRSGI